MSSTRRNFRRKLILAALITTHIIMATVVSACALPDKLSESIQSSKSYREMNDSERLEYIKGKSVLIARSLGNKKPGDTSQAAAIRIRQFVDEYAKRIDGDKKTDCAPGDNLKSAYERASKNAPTINQVFIEEGLSEEIGLYLAMIASEHCVCYQSDTGPLGLFQLSSSVARSHGLTVKRTPGRDDERCQVEPASYAAARYLNSEAEKHPADSLNILKALMTYHVGTGYFNKKIATKGDEVAGYWELVSMEPGTGDSWSREAADYLPKFFAAAIIGENPRDFELDIAPLSSLAK